MRDHFCVSLAIDCRHILIEIVSREVALRLCVVAHEAV